MKSIYTIITLALLIFLLDGCKKNSSTSTSDSQSQKLISGNFYFNEGLNTLCMTSDNGFVVAALYQGNQIYVAKTNSSFDVLWTKMVGSIVSSVGGIVQSDDNGYVIVSNTRDTSSYPEKLFVDLIKLDQSGNQLWEKKYRFNYLYEQGFALKETSDKGFIIITVNNSCLALLKINSTGDSLWSHTYTGHSISIGGGMDIQITPDKGYIAVEDMMILRTDSAGNQLWEIGTDANCLTNVRVLPDGSCVALGNVAIFPPDSSNRTEYVLMKYDASGNKLWEKPYSSKSDVWPANLCLTTEGGFIFSGQREINPGDSYVTDIIKTDGNGNELASKTINIGRVAEPRGLVWQNGSYVYYGGTSIGEGTDYYLMFMRFNF
jgi:hypothetical protein